MSNQEELKAHLLKTHKHLVRIRLHKLDMLRTTEAIEWDIRRVWQNPKTRAGNPGSIACRRKMLRNGAYESIVSEITYLSRHISNVENELAEMGCDEY